MGTRTLPERLASIGQDAPRPTFPIRESPDCALSLASCRASSSVLGHSRSPDRVGTYSDRHLTAPVVASRRGEWEGAYAGIGTIEATTPRIVALLRAAIHRDQLAAGRGEHFAVLALVASAVARCEPRGPAVGRARPVRPQGACDYRGGSGARRRVLMRRLLVHGCLPGDLRTASDDGDQRGKERRSARHQGSIPDRRNASSFCECSGSSRQSCTTEEDRRPPCRGQTLERILRAFTSHSPSSRTVSFSTSPDQGGQTLIVLEVGALIPFEVERRAVRSGSSP